MLQDHPDYDTDQEDCDANREEANHGTTSCEDTVDLIDQLLVAMSVHVEMLVVAISPELESHMVTPTPLTVNESEGADSAAARRLAEQVWVEEASMLPGLVHGIT